MQNFYKLGFALVIVIAIAIGMRDFADHAPSNGVSAQTSPVATPSAPTNGFSRFFGTVEFNGRLVTDPVMVMGIVNGNMCGATTASSGNYTLDVQPASAKAGCGNDGDVIKFRLSYAPLNLSGDAAQTGAFKANQSTSLNLTVGQAAPATGTPSAGATAAPTQTGVPATATATRTTTATATTAATQTVTATSTATRTATPTATSTTTATATQTATPTAAPSANLPGPVINGGCAMAAIELAGPAYAGQRVALKTTMACTADRIETALVIANNMRGESKQVDFKATVVQPLEIGFMAIGAGDYVVTLVVGPVQSGPFVIRVVNAPVPDVIRIKKVENRLVVSGYTCTSRGPISVNGPSAQVPQSGTLYVLEITGTGETALVYAQLDEVTCTQGMTTAQAEAMAQQQGLKFDDKAYPNR